MNLSNQMNKLIVTFIATLVLIVSCQDRNEKPVTEASTVLPVAKKLNDFKLTLHGHGDFNLKDLKDNWSLFFFGYTRCPDVCPTELFMMSEMVRLIEKEPESVKQFPQVIFVSVDPQQDTPKSLQEYASFYHPSFKGITGTQEEVDKLASSMGAFYERAYHMNGSQLIMEPDDEIPEALKDSYLINHSASIVLTNPDGDMHAVFSTPHTPDVMVRDLASIQKAW